MISTAMCWRAAPATARTLSSDIETSARTIWKMARPKVFGAGGTGVWAGSFAFRARVSATISRNSFHTTQRRMNAAGASVRPMTSRSCVAKMAKRMRSTAAEPIPSTIAFRRSSCGSPAAAMPTTTFTHFHPDHVGGAEEAARERERPSCPGRPRLRPVRARLGSDDWPERMALWFVRHGAPAPIADDLIKEGHAFAPFIRYALNPDLLYEGSEVGGWEVIELPGHADGHRGFLRDGVSIGGDHLLPDLAGGRALSGKPAGSPRRLPRVVAANDRTGAEHRLPRSRRADPGRRRARAQADRAPSVAAGPHRGGALQEPTHSLRGVARGVRRGLGPTQRRFAVAETLSHLERLVREVRAAATGPTGALPILHARWTTKSRLVPTPTGSGRDGASAAFSIRRTPSSSRPSMASSRRGERASSSSTIRGTGARATSCASLWTRRDSSPPCSRRNAHLAGDRCARRASPLQVFDE